MTLWQTLNAQIDPQAVEELLNGQLNVFQCEKCDMKAGIEIPFAFHDMQLQMYVQFLPWEIVAEGADWLDNFDERGEYNLPPSQNSNEAMSFLQQQLPEYMCRQHVVFSMQELIQYVLFRQVLAERHGVQAETPEA